MRIVAALGGSALLPAGQARTSESDRAATMIAAKALARIALDHQLIVTHGEVSARDHLADNGHTHAVGADAQEAPPGSMIGYMIERELCNWLPFDTPVATLMITIEVDPDDPAFDTPDGFAGPVFGEDPAEEIAVRTEWQLRVDARGCRRVVPSPQPRRVFQLRPIRWLAEKGTVVICAIGDGAPTVYNDNGDLEGTEAVIDRDFAAELLARQIEADLFLSATDAEAVFLDWGTRDQRAVKTASPEALERHGFAAGSMAPKVAAACQFVRATGKPAAIGRLSDLSAVVAGKKGTLISDDVTGVTFHDAGDELGPLIGREMRHGT